MRVLGIDQSLTSTGLALVEVGPWPEVVELARIQPKKPAKLEGLAERQADHERLSKILRAIETRIWPAGRRHDAGYEPTGAPCTDEPVPDLVVGIEGPSHGSSHATVATFGLWGVVTQRLWEWGVPYYVVTPGQRAKYATGSGAAGKDEVLAAVIRRYMPLEIKGNDVADALVIAAMGARHYGDPLEGDMPKANLAPMGVIEWPTTS